MNSQCRLCQRPAIEDPRGVFGDQLARLCGAHWEEAWDRHAALKRQFRALCEQGVHPRVADRMLCVQIDREPPRPLRASKE